MRRFACCCCHGSDLRKTAPSSTTRFPSLSPSLRAERSNPESARGTSLDCFVARAPRNDGGESSARNDGGETLAPHGQRHHVIAVLDRALQHRVFQLEIETVGGANTALRRKRAAEHGAAVREFPTVEATRDEVGDRQHRVERALLVE